MLWLALHCPTLALDCILRRWPSGLVPALAVTDLDGSKRIVAMATRSAHAGGVHAGQAVATALALLPDLVLVARDADGEARALNEADVDNNRAALKKAGYLRRDDRAVERKKAGLKKARKAPQYSKR